MNSAFNTPQNLWAGHPEHYGIHLTPNADGTLRGEILEPWGPLMTDSFVPSFTPVGAPGVTKKPWMRELSGYPMQMVGEETLMDGSARLLRICIILIGMFRPERWLVGEDEVSQAKLREMIGVQELAFGYGKWQCLGKGLVAIELGSGCAGAL